MSVVTKYFELLIIVLFRSLYYLLFLTFWLLIYPNKFHNFVAGGVVGGGTLKTQKINPSNYSCKVKDNCPDAATRGGL